MEESDRESKKSAFPSWRRYAGMGSEFAGGMIGLTLLGYWIDHRYGTGMKATLIGASFGIVGGMYNFIRQAIALSKSAQSENDAERHEHGTQPYPDDRHESGPDRKG